MRDIYIEYSSVTCPNDCCYQLSEDELPPEWGKVDTCFAMFAYTKCAGSSSLVIFNDGLVGLECVIGLSRWYLLPELGVFASHQLEVNIDYIFDNGWVKYAED